MDTGLTNHDGDQGGRHGEEGAEADDSAGGGVGGRGGVELPERWSVQRKTELVLRLLRGEPLDAVSRESQVPAHELEGWKRVFLETRHAGAEETEPSPRSAS